MVWHIVGVKKGEPPRYFECAECGFGEVVSSIPMGFWETPCQDRKTLEAAKKRYEEYRKSAGLLPLGQFVEKRLSVEKYEDL